MLLSVPKSLLKCQNMTAFQKQHVAREENRNAFQRHKWAQTKWFARSNTILFHFTCPRKLHIARYLCMFWCNPLVHHLVLELTFDLVRSPFGLGYLFNLHQNEIFRDVYELSLCSPSMPAQTKAETGGALTKTAIYTRHGDVGSCHRWIMQFITRPDNPTHV